MTGHLTDSPTRHDRLNVKAYAEALTQFVLTCDTPMAVGIQGEWGSGKSSLMRMVSGPARRTALRVDCRYRPRGDSPNVPVQARVH